VEKLGWTAAVLRCICLVAGFEGGEDGRGYNDRNDVVRMTFFLQ
jgi:hypothetical protein